MPGMRGGSRASLPGKPIHRFGDHRTGVLAGPAQRIDERHQDVALQDEVVGPMRN